MVIVPEMIGSIVGVYNGKVFNQVEIKVCSDYVLRDILSTGKRSPISPLDYVVQITVNCQWRVSYI